MKLTICTFTGVDDAVDPVSLVAIEKAYPFVEWGVAYNPAYAGKPRYPTLSWIKTFLRASPLGAKALHASGAGLTEFCSGHPQIMQLLENFPRMQMNFDAACEENEISMMAAKARAETQKHFIFPYNEETKKFLPRFERKNISVLFDASCGQGKSPSHWSPPLAGYFCGYAGGISQANIVATLDALTKIVPSNEPIWIDMESGVRTDNQFDLNKVVAILDVLKARFF